MGIIRGAAVTCEQVQLSISTEREITGVVVGKGLRNAHDFAQTLGRIASFADAPFLDMRGPFVGLACVVEIKAAVLFELWVKHEPKQTLLAVGVLA